MSRISEAMLLAARNGPEPSPPVGADDPPFVASESPPDTSGPETRLLRPPPPLVPRTRALPAEVGRQEAREDVQVLDVIRVLLRRWKSIAAVVITSVGIAAAYNQLATPVYEARARLLIEPDSPAVVPFRPLTEETGRLDYFVTQLEVLRSRTLARQTLENLRLLSQDSALQSSEISRMLVSLTVSPIRTEVGDTRVVNLQFRSTDPAYAARVLNGLARTYIDRNLEARRQGSREASKWLEQRLAELRKQVTTGAGALQAYREQEDAVSLDDRQNIVVQKLEQLNAAVTNARTDRIGKEMLYRQLSALQESGAPLDTFPPILSNTFIQAQKAELAALQRERAQLAERLGDLHPDMIRQDAAIATAERRVNAEIGKVVEGIRLDYRAAQARERGLVAALEEQKREVLDLNQKAIAYGALQRDAASTQQIFESVLQRAKETELSGELQANNVRLLDAAEVPRSPIWPRTRLNLILALLGGGFVAVGLVLGLEYLNPRLARPDDVGEALGVSLIGVAPRVEGPLHVDSLPPAFEEALRNIRTRIVLSPVAAAARTLAVTSTTTGEGKTVVASSLAVSMAMAGRRVLLVDADLRRPKVHRTFDVPISPGLANVMAGETKPSAALFKTTVEGLFILAAGAGVPRASDLLDSERLSRLIEGFGKVFDNVVLDCPPVMAVADASIIANAASSVLFVVGAGATSRQGAQVALRRLASVQAHVIGVVFNKAAFHDQTDYSYDASHGYDTYGP